MDFIGLNLQVGERPGSVVFRVRRVISWLQSVHLDIDLLVGPMARI
jgi:hypothetical protein